MSQHIFQFDVLIIGAGLSGIGAAYRLQSQCKEKTYAILESRSAIGGTWDVFRYPGVRSDSDMFTLGYAFRPWPNAKSIADGEEIRDYIETTAREFDIHQHIRFNHRVRSAKWSTSTNSWTLEVDLNPKKSHAGAEEQTHTYTCSFLYICSGYFNHADGYRPSLPGIEAFKGPVIHPQNWPKDLDYRDKRIAVIGSGATAVTLVPALSATAQHVTMLQRSPSYLASLSLKDSWSEPLSKVLPATWVYRLIRWKNCALQIGSYQIARRLPRLTRKLLHWGVKAELPKGYPMDVHFNPTYAPWDQRLCIVPQGDFFRAIQSGKASIETDVISSFSSRHIALSSGKKIEADIVVMATGLKLQTCGGIQIHVDGRLIALHETWVYKGVMLSSVPNLAICMGYTNASWTLRADLSSKYVCRLLKYMDRHGYTKCVTTPDPGMSAQPLLNLNAGYIMRASEHLPKQGMHKPWHTPQNYFLDALFMRCSRVNDGVIKFF